MTVTTPTPTHNGVNLKDRLKLVDPGTSADSHEIQIVADNSGTEQTGTIKTAFGADPYIRISPPNGAGAATAALDINDTQMNPADPGNYDLGSSGSKFKDGYFGGNITVDGTVDALDVANHDHDGTASGGVNVEGTNIASTGETGASKFLREDGDDSSSWQALPTASESVVGIAEIATQTETDTGTDDTRFITPKKLADWDTNAKHRSMNYRISPTANGVIYMIGWNIVTDSAYALSNAAPLTISEAAYHSHIVIDASSVVGAPFDLTITGRSISETDATETPGDTETISITANGYYQSTKSWLDAVVLSVPAGKTMTVDVYRTTYCDNGNIDFTLTGARVEWTPDAATWDLNVDIIKVNANGSLTTVDTFTFANTDGVLRAANTKPGKYKRLDYNTSISGSTSEGLIVYVDQTGLQDFLIGVKYDEE